MTKIKWAGTLSTTQRNNIGLIQVRMHNINSETFEFDIVDGNGELYDLTNRKVLFCTYFDKFSPVEQYARVISKGKIQYTMNKYDMQQPVRINFAYFKIMKENGDVVDTTQNFSYDIIQSIESTCMDSEPYIVRLEEVLDALSNVRDEVMKDIQTIINNFNKQVIQQQQDFDKWFDSVKEIIESIDPGGLLLSEIIKARDNEKDLDTRLKRDKKILEQEIEWLKNEHYFIKTGEIHMTRTLIDDDFSKNHEVTTVGQVSNPTETHPIIIATVDDTEQNRFKLFKVGDM